VEFVVWFGVLSIGGILALLVFLLFAVFVLSVYTSLSLSGADLRGPLQYFHVKHRMSQPSPARCPE